MFLTSDKTYKTYRGSLCNINLSLKINWKKGIYQKFVNKRPLGSLQKTIYTTYLHNLSTQQSKHNLIEQNLKIMKE